MTRARHIRMWLLTVAVGCGCLSPLVGCSHRVTDAARDAARADTVRLVKWRTDTVLDRDTVLVRQVGDTVCREVTRWRWRVREVHDTVLRARCDTVRTEVPVEVRVPVEVERERGWWETLLLWAGGIALAAAAVWLAVRVKARLRGVGERK